VQGADFKSLYYCKERKNQKKKKKKPQKIEKENASGFQGEEKGDVVNINKIISNLN
jgi:hypothetical protein